MITVMNEIIRLRYKQDMNVQSLDIHTKNPSVYFLFIKGSFEKKTRPKNGHYT